MITTTPLQSIRNHCLNCCKNLPEEVRVCDAHDQCPIWPLRFGKKPDGFNGNVLKTINAQCEMCRGPDFRVKDCPNKSCRLFPFRLSKNPNRKGIGRKASAEEMEKIRQAKSLTELKSATASSNKTRNSQLGNSVQENGVEIAQNTAKNGVSGSLPGAAR